MNAVATASYGRPGVEIPDHRGRTGLDRKGRDLDRNPRVKVRDVELVAAGWHVLRATTFDYQRADGTWTRERRETYDRGNGATILLYDPDRGTVLLTRQFRYPVYVNDHPDGMLIETAAGLLDDDDPDTAIRRETEEELGVRVSRLERVFDVYMSPARSPNGCTSTPPSTPRRAASRPVGGWLTTARTSRCSSCRFAPRSP
jgi:8-oxo-dGTP pyrophosphatase MutT (NUDIX family)